MAITVEARVVEEKQKPLVKKGLKVIEAIEKEIMNPSSVSWNSWSNWQNGPN